jgi:hypothetical protein
MNRLLNVGMPANQLLAFACEWFNRRLQQHRADLLSHATRHHNVLREIEESLGISLEPEIRKKLMDLTDGINDCEFQKRDEFLLVHSR